MVDFAFLQFHQRSVGRWEEEETVEAHCHWNRRMGIRVAPMIVYQERSASEVLHHNSELLQLGDLLRCIAILCFDTVGQLDAAMVGDIDQKKLSRLPQAAV